MATSEQFDIVKVTKEAINKRIKEIAEEEYEAAEVRIKERRHEAITGVCLAVERYVSFERMGQTLRIEIKDSTTP